MKERADIGIIGLAVMGENLALNMEGHGFTVAVHNRTVPGVEEGVVERFLAGRGKGKNVIGEPTLEGFVRALAAPRKVMMMVKAGDPVDELIGRLAPLLERGDILIDGGNSHFADTIRRTKAAEARGLLYVGAGVSGGEEGALRGPSLMPGGSPAAWPAVRPIFRAIAAKAPDGTPCADWVGPDGAGHFVKMVHNGIEYGDMQLIAESYGLMAGLLGMGADEMSGVFAAWNRGDLESYLVAITADILAFKDSDGKPLIDKILDTAGQKGTGKWASTVALDLGVPLTLISEAVFGRCLSAAKEERVEASRALRGPERRAGAVDRASFLSDLEKALYAAKVVSYAQGFELLRAAAGEFHWDLDYGGIAMLWRGGCIIRSAFLGRIKDAFGREPALPNLLLDPFFRERIEASEEAWRRVAAAAVTNGAWAPAMASGLSYLDGLRSARLPTSLVQAQRDYFGAHKYERVDRPRGEFYHTDWTGRGGSTASGTYNV
ncbi:MAG TPA: decarboxylating NADP(+)-dependent phosphogluconate dehydrogenase [Terriglobales bacterium]|nr:decarboxylating NADP(+)-dependent phosphogluconate dehydrogenase [Terriglobales bacterium]